MRARAGLTLLWVLTAAASVGCREEALLPPPVSEAPVSVIAERGEVRPTVVFDAIVVAGAEFPVLAPSAGSPIQFGDDAITFRREDGSVERLEYGRGAKLLRPLVEVGTPVPGSYPIALLRYEGFVMRASVPAGDLYRLRGPVEEVLASIDDGPGPFPCPPIGPIPTFEEALAEGGVDGEALARRFVRCAVPADVPVLAGLPGKVALRLEGARDVVVLPLEAVAGRAERGRVLVREGNRWEEREVRLGPHDGVRVAVLEGLREGEVVRIPGPVLGDGP